MGRRIVIFVAVGAGLLLGAGPVAACGFLVAPNGTVQLTRTTTLAAYTDGIEHYVTSFEYAGGETDFGSIVPLPDIPTDVERGGDWTLQRLLREVQPLEGLALASIPASSFEDERVEILLETEIDALDITILKGGGPEVTAWANDHGYFLPPDAGEVLTFYAERSPIFMAARFDASRAQELGQFAGDGTPIHLTIPTDDPWVPLRILAMGKAPGEVVDADVFLLTDQRPQVLRVPAEGIRLEESSPASDLLLDDLRSDEGMGWVPEEAWLSYLRVDVAASELGYDLAIDSTGSGMPSLVDAGLSGVDISGHSGTNPWLILPLGAVAVAGLLALFAGPMTASRRA